MNTIIASSPLQCDTHVAYGLLKARAVGLPNSEWLARMLASQRAGIGAMPQWLGLSRRSFALMMERHFSGLDPKAWGSGPERDLGRAAERSELLALFLCDCEHISEESVWMAEVLAAGCMGSDHLWQDLGLWSRADLSGMIAHNFPLLKERNDRDMKWKKFFYKQLCKQAGVYTCRAPSCEVCADYAACFGPEE